MKWACCEFVNTGAKFKSDIRVGKTDCGGGQSAPPADERLGIRSLSQNQRDQLPWSINRGDTGYDALCLCNVLGRLAVHTGQGGMCAAARSFVRPVRPDGNSPIRHVMQSWGARRIRTGGGNFTFLWL